MTEAQESAAGAAFALALDLERDEEHPDRWVTGWGTKTNLGLFRTLKEQILQAEGKAPGSPDPAITLKAENEKLRQALEITVATLTRLASSQAKAESIKGTLDLIHTALYGAGEDGGGQ